MERLLQYLDDLDDFVYALALVWEKVRTFGSLAIFVSLMAIVQALGIYAAFENPPFTVAGGSLLVVGLMYRGVVYRGPVSHVLS